MRMRVFNGVVVVKGHVWGPTADGDVRLIVDTGAAYTALGRRVLRLSGYDLTDLRDSVAITTATRVEQWARINVERFGVLGELRSNFPVLAQDLPLAARVDGLLGLDFFAGHKLCLDLREGILELT